MEAEGNADEGNEDDGNADEGNVTVDEMYLFICLYFFDTSPLIRLPPHSSHSSRPTSKVTPQEQQMEAEATADEGIEARGNADEGNDDEMYLFSDDDSEDIEAELDEDSVSTEDPLPNAISFLSDGRLKLLRLL